MKKSLVDQIDALLPQTQCELCEYPGCRPYAEAITTNAAPLDRCLPGGVRVMKRLGELLEQDVSALEAGMQQKQKTPLLAKVREEDCIGCTKCIQACPVDAIIGAAKQMHVVLTDACNGCELCVPPCPVDCIELQSLPARSDQQQQQLADQSRLLFHQRQSRLERDRVLASQQHQQAKLSVDDQAVAARKSAIAAAIQRVKDKQASTDESTQA